jgi:hypothetical protein
MTSYLSDLFDYVSFNTGVELIIADGNKLRVHRRGTVKLTGLDDKRIKMPDVVYIPGLYRRLLSVGRLSERGLSVEFQRLSCIIRSASRVIAMRNKVGKSFLLDCQQEKARFVEYSGDDSKWELLHARMGHPSKDALIRPSVPRSAYLW